MDTNIELHFVLRFRNRETGATFQDATCQTIHDAHTVIRRNSRMGWEFEGAGMECIKHTGFCEHETLAYQNI